MKQVLKETNLQVDYSAPLMSQNQKHMMTQVQLSLCFSEKTTVNKYAKLVETKAYAEQQTQLSTSLSCHLINQNINSHKVTYLLRLWVKVTCLLYAHLMHCRIGGKKNYDQRF